MCTLRCAAWNVRRHGVVRHGIHLLYIHWYWPWFNFDKNTILAKDSDYLSCIVAIAVGTNAKGCYRHIYSVELVLSIAGHWFNACSSTNRYRNERPPNYYSFRWMCNVHQKQTSNNAHCISNACFCNSRSFIWRKAVRCERFEAQMTLYRMRYLYQSIIRWIPLHTTIYQFYEEKCCAPQCTNNETKHNLHCVCFVVELGEKWTWQSQTLNPRIRR